MSSSTGLRLSALAIIAFSLVGALTARLWYLTAVEGEASVQAAEANRIRTLHIQAPRGRIFDRNRRVLVDNRQVRQLRVDMQLLNEAVEFDEDERNRVFERVAEELTLAGVHHSAFGIDPDTPPEPWTLDDVLQAVEDNAIGAFIPTPIAEEVPESLEIALAERQMEFPGIDVERVAVRHYPHGSLAAHLLGYVGPIQSEEEIEEIQNPDKPYDLRDEVGRGGVEATYEDWLRGTPGERVIEVDAAGNLVQEIGYTRPVPGMDIVLSLDLQVQSLLENQLRSAAETNAAPGAAGVVEDPRNGAILAMASYPTYNPNTLANGISAAEFEQLTSEEAGNAFLNRAIAGVYAPGSTFKPVTALAGLRAEVVRPIDSFNDDGIYEVQGCEGDSSCQFQNAGAVPNGTVNLQSSLTVSSDWYYYRIGDVLWINRERLGDDFLQQTAADWGFVAETEVDLPAEQEGHAFTPEQVAQLHEDYPEDFPFGDWTTGNTVNMSIGQGDLGVTPLQLTNAYAALANGGTLYRPHVGQAAWEPQPEDETWMQDEESPCAENPGEICTVTPSQLSVIEIPDEWRDPMMAGLLGVNVPGGTAAEAFEGFDLANFPVAGKTGTAQVSGKGDFALYVGFGPVRPGQQPEYVVSVILEDVAQFGATVAAPVARAVFDGLANPALLPPVAATEATPIPSTVDPGAEATTEDTVP